MKIVGHLGPHLRKLYIIISKISYRSKEAKVQPSFRERRNSLTSSWDEWQRMYGYNRREGYPMFCVLTGLPLGLWITRREISKDKETITDT